MMDDRPHKAHRPALSGGKAEKKDKGKGKEKQHGFNEKVSRDVSQINFISMN
jgi:ribosome biogenesis protein BMS1